MMKLDRLPLIFLITLMLPFSRLAAQKHTGEKINWAIGAKLPLAEGLQQQLGLAGAVAGIHNNVLIIAGGANFPDAMPWLGGKKNYYSDIYIFKKNTDSGIEPLGKTFRLPGNLAYPATTSTLQGVVVAGGENENGPTDKVFLIQWSPASEKLKIQDLPALPLPVANASITSDGNKLYLGGGETTNGVSEQFLTFDLDEPAAGWVKLPSLPKPVSHAVMAIQSNGDHNSIYLVGGRKKNDGATSDLYSTVYEFDLKGRNWKEKQPMPYNLSAGTGLAVGATYIMMFGGDKGEVFQKAERLIAATNIEKDPIKKEALDKQKIALQSTHPGFSREVLLYNTVTDIWTATDSIPFDAQVTTTAVKWGNDIVLPTGEIRAGIRTPNLIVGKVTTRQFFSWIDSIVVVFCFLLMTVARYFFTSSKTTTSDYFKGGQKIPKWAAGVSIFGAKLSAITFMSIPAKTYGSNWTYFFLLMTIIMVMPFVARYFIPFYRRLNVTSAYEYLNWRFNYGSRFIASLLFVLLQLGRMGIVVLLPSIALTLVTGININLCIIMIGAISIFFTMKGGIEAVIWVEVIQVLILAAGALFTLVYIPFKLDNLGEAVQTAFNYDKLKVFDLRFSFTEPTIWVVLIGGFAINLLTYGTDQTTVQRYLTTKTEKESIKSLKLGAWLTLPSTLVFFSIGTLLFLFFRQQPDQVNFALNKGDDIFPWFIVSQLPAGLSGLLIAGIFAAAMSSTEASMNSVATLLTTDFYKKFKPGVTEKQTLFFARTATLLLGIFVTCIALYMAKAGVASLWDKFNTILGLFTGTIGGAFLLGIFTRKANGTGVIMGMLISCLTQIMVQTYTDIHFLMYAFTGLLSCVAFGYLFSILTGGEKRDIGNLTIYKRQHDEINEEYAALQPAADL
jgi:solute:Na+ symporter, SSS family